MLHVRREFFLLLQKKIGSVGRWEMNHFIGMALSEILKISITALIRDKKITTRPLTKAKGFG